MSMLLSDIAAAIGATVSSKAGSIEITAFNAIDKAGTGEITFLSNPRYARYLSTTSASAIILDADHPDLPETVVPLIVKDSYLAFMTVLRILDSRDFKDIADGVSTKADIHPEAVLGENVSIAPFAVIGKGVTIGNGTRIGPGCVLMRGTAVGENCVLYPNVTVMDSCEIGNNVIIQSGAVIGSDGFGFAPHDGKLVKIPQIGIVRLEDDVEIQANTCIDRAAFGVTLVSRGVKIDNLVQIAHNVSIAGGTVVASQTGISGSTSVGAGVQIGGQAGFAGHLTIGDGSSVGAQAGVTRDIPPGEIVSGYPARPHAKELRLEASIQKLPALLRKIKALERRIDTLENGLTADSESKDT